MACVVFKLELKVLAIEGCIANWLAICASDFNLCHLFTSKCRVQRIADRSVSGYQYGLDMQPKPPRRKQLRTLTCPECQQRGLLRELLWGMPGEDFDHDKYASGGCCLPSPWPPDVECSGCGFQGYRDVISGFDMYPPVTSSYNL